MRTDNDVRREIFDALEQHTNKHHGHGRYNTPWRPGADGGTLAVTERPDYALGLAWYDHKTQESGNGITLAQRLGIALPDLHERGVVPTLVKRPAQPRGAYASMAAYAEAHGVPLEAFERFGWRETRRGRGGLAFAFDTATGTRYRYADEQAAGRKYDHDKGTHPSWYGLDRAITLANEDVIIIANGEASVVVAQHHGLPACCVTGGERASMSDELLAELKRSWPGFVMVAFDSDATGRRCAPALATQLRAVGIGCRAVDLGGSDGYDLADYCRDHGVDGVLELPTLTVATAKAAQPELRTAPTSLPMDINDLLALPHQEVRWYAPGYVRSGLGILAGLPQVGKTPLAVQLAIAIASGGMWMDHVQCRRAKVLFLGPEYSRAEIKPMFDISRMGKAVEPGWLAIKTMEDEFPTDEAGALAELEYYITELGYEVIIIDTFTAFLPPERYKQNVYRGDYNELKPYHRLSNLHDVSIIGTWHASKREIDPAKMYNGSVGLWAVAASRLTIYTDQDNKVRLSSFPRMEDRIDVALTQEKTLTGRRWIVESAKPDPVITSPQERLIYEWLKANSSVEAAATASEIAAATKIDGSSCRTILGRMVQRNYIQKTGTQRDANYFVALVAPVAPVAHVALVARDSVTTAQHDLVTQNSALESPKPQARQARQEILHNTRNNTATSATTLPDGYRVYEGVNGVYVYAPNGDMDGPMDAAHVMEWIREHQGGKRG